MVEKKSNKVSMSQLAPLKPTTLVGEEVIGLIQFSRKLQPTSRRLVMWEGEGNT